MPTYFVLSLLAVALGGAASCAHAQETYPRSGTEILSNLEKAGLEDIPDVACTESSEDEPPRLDADSGPAREDGPFYFDAKSEKLGILSNGKASSPAVYDDVAPLGGRLFVARKKACYGVVDATGRSIIPFEFNSVASRTFSAEVDGTGDLDRIAAMTLDAVRPEGHFLYRIDARSGRQIKLEGPFRYVHDMALPGSASYAIAARQGESRTGIFRSDLHAMLPARYDAVGAIDFAGSQRSWIGIGRPTERSANTFNRPVWPVEIVDSDGRRAVSLRLLALWELPSLFSRRSYGTVALLEDGTCAYFDRSWQRFEQAPAKDGKCGNADRMNRVVLSRNAQGHGVFWGLVPVDGNTKRYGQAAEDAINQGKYAWKKGYEGAFSVVATSGNEDFVVIKLAGVPAGADLKLIDRHGKDTGGVYAKFQSVCGTLYLTRDDRFYKADNDSGRPISVTAIPSIYCASF